MGEVNEAVERQRAKRRQANRMKLLTVTVFIVVFLAIAAGFGYMFFSMAMLQKQIDNLNIKIEELSEARAEYDANSDTADTGYLVSDVENLAEEGDIPRVYLTFDDGPSENTDKILDILDDYNVKATFFVVGKDVDKYAEEYERIVEEGHTIGMHSFSHNYSDIYSSEEAFTKDFDKIHDLIEDTTGVDTKYYRFPGGSSNVVSAVDMDTLKGILSDRGVVFFDWNVSSGDATTEEITCDELIDNVMTDVVKYKTSIVLLHDAANKDTTVEALPQLIESLQDIGAIILPITDDTVVVQHVTVAE